MYNPPGASDVDYINFLLASQRMFTWTEAVRNQPPQQQIDPPPVHYSFMRLLERMLKNTEMLWK